MTGTAALDRRLGLSDAVVLGLGSMLGAGVFTAYAPAADAAGRWLLAGLALAGGVAYCNATSSARLAARYPQSGGTYVYGRERLGPAWGTAAGWAFVVGKTASATAMALAVGSYAWPGHERAVAAAVVAALTALGYRGVHRGALATRVVVAVVLAVLALVAVTALGSGGPDDPVAADGTGAGALGILEAAGFLFFAFAGYARIATLGEEVRDPERTIPRAVPIALGVTLAVYTVVALALLTALGPAGIAATDAPVAAAAPEALRPLVRVAAVAAAAGALLGLLLGISRTTLAMARDGRLPRALAAVHPRFAVPHRAELAVGAVVLALVLAVDLRGAIGVSSVLVLVYYAIANASALTLEGSAGSRLVPVLGLVGCVVVAAALALRVAVPG
ncbi:MAG: APC family permease [Actinomycetes bacterium]